MGGFQSFEATTRPDQGPPRVAALRAAMAAAGVDAFLVPRADAHQGEYVAPRDERLAWLTGFTGSAGFAAVLAERAGLFVDGRYTLQAAAQVDTEVITPLPWPKTELGAWLAEALPQGGTVGFDPWLHSAQQIDKLREGGAAAGLTYVPVENLVDAVWEDQPAPPMVPVWIHPAELAGEDHGAKRARLAEGLRADGVSAAVLTLPDSLAWLLNLRGGDIARTPVPHGFGILHDDGRVQLFLAAEKLSPEVRAHLGNDVAVAAPGDLISALERLEGKVRIEAGSLPVALRDVLAEPVAGVEPVKRAKARKNDRELAGMAAAHRRDAVAVARFLHWLDGAAPSGGLTEIDVVRQLETMRAEAAELRDIAFETIAGSGPNGAIVHYRVTEETNRTIVPGDLLLVDSGAQYTDGTTDITRTVATGPVTAEQRACFTRVLTGMIGMSRLRWPKGLAGRDIDAVARMALWEAGLDYDHGTGHGVGAYLGVHEGPQSLSRRGEVALEVGMVLSNEPGYYRVGAFGIRIENLIHVVEAPALEGADAREMLAFATLTLAPIDRRLIDAALLSAADRAWLDAYHARVAAEIGPLVPADVATWLAAATAPL